MKKRETEFDRWVKKNYDHILAELLKGESHQVLREAFNAGRRAERRGKKG